MAVCESYVDGLSCSRHMQRQLNRSRLKRIFERVEYNIEDSCGFDSDLSSSTTTSQTHRGQIIESSWKASHELIRTYTLGSVWITTEVTDGLYSESQANLYVVTAIFR